MLKDELIWVSVWEVILVFKVFEFYFLKCLFVSYECLYGKDIFMYIMIGKYNEWNKIGVLDWIDIVSKEFGFEY